MTYYKVLKKIDGELFSATVTPFYMQYKLNTVNRAEIGYLFVFKELEKAVEFVGGDTNDFSIWAVKSDDKPIEIYSRANLLSDKNEFIQFWKYKDYEMHGYNAVPKGTLGVKSLTLVKEVGRK